jgi:hypothetical protein
MNAMDGTRRAATDHDEKYYITNWLRYMAAKTNILKECKDFYAHHMKNIHKKLLQKLPTGSKLTRGLLLSRGLPAN